MAFKYFNARSHLASSGHNATLQVTKATLSRARSTFTREVVSLLEAHAQVLFSRPGTEPTSKPSALCLFAILFALYIKNI